MKKILIPILGMTALTFFNSCSREFIDVNENVNQQYENQATPKDRLNAAETVVFRTQANTMNRFGNLMMNAWGGNVYFYASPYGDEFKMIANSTFYDEIWDNLYRGVANYQAIIDNPAAASYPHHVAIAKIMKAYYMQMIVDLYNDVPYSEAFKFQANKTPKYDKGKDVYKGLINELNQALVLIGKTPANATFSLITAEDAIFGATSADMSNWTKMANTVKLKMLVRLSKCTDPEVIAWRNTELQAMSALTLNTNNFITADVKINPGYTPASAVQRNPFYQAFGRIDIDANDLNPTWRQTFASDFIVKTLTGQTTLTAGVVDARIQRLFIAQALSAPTTAIGAYKGQAQGAQKEDGAEEGDFAMLGLFMLYNNGTTGPNTTTALASNSGLVLTLSEVRFLQAEAATVYPATMLFNAQTSFNDGIIQSFTTFGSSSAAATNYLASVAAKPGVGWSATTNKIEAIQYQKWIALTHINPTETFISYNKTGFPQLPMPVGSSYPTRPKRLMYPQTEYIANTANVPNPAVNDMYTINQYTPFWQK